MPSVVSAGGRRNTTMSPMWTEWKSYDNLLTKTLSPGSKVGTIEGDGM